MSRKWTSSIYAFFNVTPLIEYIDGRKCHTFKCLAKGCKHTIRRFLDGKDGQSTGNMRRHAKTCWGEDAVAAADNAKDASQARTKVVQGVLRTGSITTAFERKGKVKVTYSHKQHTRTETKCILQQVTDPLAQHSTGPRLCAGFPKACNHFR